MPRPTPRLAPVTSASLPDSIIVASKSPDHSFEPASPSLAGRPGFRGTIRHGHDRRLPRALGGGPAGQVAVQLPGPRRQGARLLHLSRLPRADAPPGPAPGAPEAPRPGRSGAPRLPAGPRADRGVRRLRADRGHRGSGLPADAAELRIRPGEAHPRRAGLRGQGGPDDEGLLRLVPPAPRASPALGSLAIVAGAPQPGVDPGRQRFGRA